MKVYTISITITATKLESLVYVFSAGKEDLRLLIYPCVLLLTASVSIIGLGIFQYLSASTEAKVKSAGSN